MASLWYSRVSQSSELEQGDFILNAYLPRAVNYTAKDFSKLAKESSVSWSHGDWVVLTQSCDLAEENGKSLDKVILCPVFTLSEFVKQNSAYAGDSEKKMGKRANIINNREVGLHALKQTGYAYYPSEPYIINFYDAISVDADTLVE